jgi:hypothetical protein
MSSNLVRGAISIAMLSAIALPARAEEPGWVNRRPHPKYPPETFLVGVGSASMTGSEERDRGQAEASARKDVLAQIQVTVQGEFQAVEAEGRKNGQIVDVASFSDLTKQSVEGTLEGVRIVEVYKAAGTKTVFALAVLERRSAAEGLASSIRASNEAIRAAFAKSANASSGDAAMRAMIEAARESEKAEANAALYRALTRQSIETLRRADVREKVSDLVGGMSFTVKSGNAQPATSGAPLSDPIVFELTLNGRPFDNVPLAISADGPAKVPADAKTGADGTASIRVAEVKSTGAPEHHVTAQVGWPLYLKQRDPKLTPEALGLTALSALASYKFKTVATTRIVIAIDERINWKDNAKVEPPERPVFGPRLAELLANQGFDVRPATSVGSKSAADLAKASPSDLKAWVSSEAEVIVTGVMSSDFMNKMCEKCPVFYKASGSIRAVDTRTGRTLAEKAEDGKKGVGTSEVKAGTKALEEAAKDNADAFVTALVAGLGR